MFCRLLLVLALAGIVGAATPAAAERRVALVIGIGQYENLSRLDNPVSDAQAIAASLERFGFEVFAHYDLQRGDFLDALEAFQHEADRADVALVYYAGHGMEVAGKNILAPTDMEISCEPKQTRRAVEVKQLFDSLGAAPNQIVLLDSCRNDPYPQCASRGAASGSGFRGLQRVAPTDTSLLIANATLSGQLAADGDTGGHSPFATALLARFSTDGGAPIRDMLDRIARDVRSATGGAQVPEITTQGGAPDLCLGACGGEPADTADTGSAERQPAGGELARIRDMMEELERQNRSAPPADTTPPDKSAYEDALAVNTCGAFEAFGRAYPGSFYAELAKERASALCAPPEQEQAALTPDQPEQGDELGIICANCAEPEQQAAVTPDTPSERDYAVGFIFPDSSERRLQRGDLAGLSARDLRLARNEIFARKGRFFNSADLTQHFQQFSWYQPYAWEVPLNATEKANVALIQAEEKRR